MMKFIIGYPNVRWWEAITISWTYLKLVIVKLSLSYMYDASTFFFFIIVDVWASLRPPRLIPRGPGV